MRFLRYAVAFLAVVAWRADAGQADPAALAQEARQALGAAKYDRAAALYGELCRQMPDVAGLRLNLGIALLQGGKLEQAAVELRKARAQDPALMPAALMLGVTMGRMGRPAEAVEPLEAALKADPNNAVALLESGDAHLALRRYGVAIERFRRLTAVEPRNPKAWRGLGLSCAERSREIFAKLPPDSAPALVLLARARLDEEKTGTAFGLLRRAIAKDPAVPGARGLLAEVYRRTNHPEWAAAESANEHALRARPQGAYAEALDVSHESLQAFSKLAELPESPELRETESDAARLRGAYGDSVAALRKAMALRPGDRRLERELARSLWLARDYDAALPLLAKHGLDYERGFALLETGKAEEARPLLERAARASKRAETLAALGRVYLETGQPAQAVEPLKAALDTDEDGSLHFQLARAYQRSGRAVEARAMDAESARLREAAARHRESAARETEVTGP